MTSFNHYTPHPQVIEALVKPENFHEIEKSFVTACEISQNAPVVDDVPAITLNTETTRILANKVMHRVSDRLGVTPKHVPAIFHEADAVPTLVREQLLSRGFVASEDRVRGIINSVNNPTLPSQLSIYFFMGSSGRLKLSSLYRNVGQGHFEYGKMIFRQRSAIGAIMLIYERLPADYAETVLAHEFTHHLQMEARIFTSLPREVIEGHAIGVQSLYAHELSDDPAGQKLLIAEHTFIPFYLQALLYLQQASGTSFSADALKFIQSFREQGMHVPDEMLLHSLGAAYFQLLEDRFGPDIYLNYLNGKLFALS